MKRFGGLLQQIADMDNLRLAFVKARRGKQTSGEVVAFASDIEKNLQRLRNQILSGDVSVGKYHTFEIFDPKRRMICAASFDERVLHHAIINVCHQYFDRQLIYDTYATRVGKGQFSALYRARKAFRKYHYVLKLDVRKYFDSISHQQLAQKLRRLFKDRQLIEILDKIIYSYCVRPGYGLPIGNLTSQYFANSYLSDLDHYIKEKLKVKMYVRYMDDMLIFAESRSQLKEIFLQVSDYLGNLDLALKPPVLSNSTQGIVFLGYKLFKDKIKLSHRSRIRFVRKLKFYTELLRNGNWTQEQYQAHLLPLYSFVRYAYSKRFRIDKIHRLKI